MATNKQGRILKHRIEDGGWSIQEFAGAMGVHRVTLSRYFKLDTLPDDVARDAAKILNVTIDDLLAPDVPDFIADPAAELVTLREELDRVRRELQAEMQEREDLERQLEREKAAHLDTLRAAGLLPGKRNGEDDRLYKINLEQ